METGSKMALQDLFHLVQNYSSHISSALNHETVYIIYGKDKV